MPDRLRQPAFTLIELLVVISIVALLLVILLPALGKARESGRTLVCLSQQRQMSLALEVYVNDNRDRYCLAYGSDGPLMLSWEVNTDAGTGTHTPGLLWGSYQVDALQQCPSFDGPDNWSQFPYTGYNYNTSFVGHGEFEARPDPVKAAELTDPASCATFGDGEYAAGANKFMRSPLPHAGDTSGNFIREAGTQGYRHSDATNAMFADGHGRTIIERYTAGLAVAEGTGFLSEDNSLYDLE